MSDGPITADSRTWVVLFETMLDLTPPWRDRQWLTVVVRAGDRDRAIEAAERILRRRYADRISGVDLRDAEPMPEDEQDGVVVRGRACGLVPGPGTSEPIPPGTAP